MNHPGFVNKSDQLSLAELEFVLVSRHATETAHLKLTARGQEEEHVGGVITCSAKYNAIRGNVMGYITSRVSVQDLCTLK